MAIIAMPAPLSAILVNVQTMDLKCGISGSSFINISCSFLMFFLISKRLWAIFISPVKKQSMAFKNMLWASSLRLSILFIICLLNLSLQLSLNSMAVLAMFSA